MWRVSAHLRIYSTNGFSACVRNLGIDVKNFCACTHIFHWCISCVCTQKHAHIQLADFLGLHDETYMGQGEFMRMYALILLSDCVSPFAVLDFPKSLLEIYLFLRIKSTVDSTGLLTVFIYSRR